MTLTKERDVQDTPICLDEDVAVIGEIGRDRRVLGLHAADPGSISGTPEGSSKSHLE